MWQEVPAILETLDEGGSTKVHGFNMFLKALDVAAKSHMAAGLRGASRGQEIMNKKQRCVCKPVSTDESSV